MPNLFPANRKKGKFSYFTPIYAPATAEPAK